VSFDKRGWGLAKLKASLTRLVKLSLDPMELIDDSVAYKKLQDLASKPMEVSVDVEQVFVRATKVGDQVAVVARGWSLTPAVTIIMTRDEAFKFIEELSAVLKK